MSESYSSGNIFVKTNLFGSANIPQMNEPKKSLGMEVLFKALADRTRLRIINLVAQDEICVCFFVEVLQVKQSGISRHLAYLRKAGLVRARRDGKWIHYRLAELPDPDAAHVLNEVRARLAQNSEMQLDRKRFLSLCRSAQPPVQLQRAPRPTSLAL